MASFCHVTWMHWATALVCLALDNTFEGPAERAELDGAAHPLSATDAITVALVKNRNFMSCPR
ncbi:hypothetical protein JMN21_26575 [Pseudomonas syringae pv. actinidiae]|nr:hypothetical protein [Pseudomonas syringae]EPM94713.1 hypothetical protein A259_33271 [Pseudomonas syringae pv. actinidiae ICMP 19070]EPN67101.1 hypothetical protein A234_30570 [Pseudomonas syringae pv. actinidiae ICMP 19101]EPN70245.1 hypothetical protein A235_04593 [Pseudomonas syringae pv. actinidiae ICMP 19079]EGH65578.1 hypothetical protein PSYAC_11831 [Pseudomonas syringae pv. actinidiae str. M302091]EPM54913.1 hypothetical protein A264_24335 [Pseudomonas syringae pv. actinidiae ICMP 